MPADQDPALAVCALSPEHRPIRRVPSRESQLVLPEDKSQTVPGLSVGTQPVYPSCLYSQRVIGEVMRAAGPELAALGYGPPPECPLPD